MSAHGNRYVTVGAAYGFVDGFKKGLDGGVHRFDERCANPGEDKDFFMRFRAALEKADKALA